MVNYILIPRFIQKALNRHKLPLSSFIDFNKMREFLSINDIVLVQTVQRNEHWKTLLDINVTEDKDFWYSSDMSLYNLWYDSATEENKAYLVNILSVLVESGQANDEIAERLFNKHDCINTDNNPSNAGTDAVDCVEVVKEPEVQSYEIHDIGPKYYGIILESNVFPNRDFSNKLIKDILKSMYLYCSQSEVARSPLFKLYMSRL